MKKFEEIIKEIKEVSKSSKDLKAEKEQMNNRTKKCELQEKILYEEIKVKYLQNNAKIALFNEVIPLVLEILSKYKQELYSGITKEKIQVEIAQRTGCYLYLTKHQPYILTPITFPSCSISFGCKHTNGKNKSLLVDNNIQLVEKDELELLHINKNYFTDINGIIKEMKELREKAKEKQEELMKICSSYNNLIVDGIDHLYYNKFIYKNV